MSALPPKADIRAFGEYSQAGGAIATRLVQYLVRSLAVDAADRFDQFNQIDQARHAAGVCQYRANRDYQARCRFIKSRFTAPSIVRAQHLDDSLIEICQRIGHTQRDQLGAVLSKVSTLNRLLCARCAQGARLGAEDRQPYRQAAGVVAEAKARRATIYSAAIRTTERH